MTGPPILVDRVMKARGESDCSLCWGLIRVGDRIGRLTDGSRAWVHVRCLPSIRDSMLRAKQLETFWCEHCHGTHPLEQHSNCRQSENQSEGTTP